MTGEMTQEQPWHIEIRVAGGSGKTTVARSLMARYGRIEPWLVRQGIEYQSRSGERKVWSGGRKPAAYILSQGGAGESEEGRELAVIGRYESAAGGADTIPSCDALYKIAETHLALGRDTLQEGRLMSWGRNERPLSLRDRGLARLFFVHLDSTPEFCLRSTLARRDAKGEVTSDDRRLKLLAKAEHEIGCARSSARRLMDAGVEVVTLFNEERESAARLIAERLGVADRPEQALVIPIPGKQAELW